MTTYIVYRGGSIPVIPEETTYKNKPIVNEEVDENFYSIEQNKLDTDELTKIFKDLKDEHS